MNGKLRAAQLAIRFVRDGMVLGIGSGSTVEIFLELLRNTVKKLELEIYGIPSSYLSQLLAAKAGVKIVDLCEFDEIDLYIDGADQVDSNFNCIKGGGAAMTREKILANASNKVLIIVDDSKLTEKLSFPVPVEILPFSYGFVKKRIEEICKECILRIGKRKFGPIITDNGNFILDCKFEELRDIKKLEMEINSIPGVIENGLFPNSLIDSVIVGPNTG